jgi:hypothetical protein
MLYLASSPLSDSTGYVQILDVTDPGQPVALGRYEGVSAPIAEIVASDSLVFLAADASLILWARVRPVLTGYELVTKKRNQSNDWLRFAPDARVPLFDN